jgi:hypothetical protein
MILSPACGQRPIEPRINAERVGSRKSQTPKKAAKLKPSILSAALEFLWDLLFGLWNFSVAGVCLPTAGFASG